MRRPEPSSAQTLVTKVAQGLVGEAPACRPSGKGKDYQVGPAAGQISSLEMVPWDQLGPGDTVRIFARPQPYRGKFLLSAHGTVAAPVRICGVAGPDGERPVIDGANAVSRSELNYGHPLHQSRSIILVNRPGGDNWKDHPTHIIIEGLELRGANPANTFTDTGGVQRGYEEFGACIWIERGHWITIANNEIHDCTNGIFSRSTEDGEFAVTKEIVIRLNHIHSNGVVDNDHMHNSYVQSVGVLYEFNHYGPLRPGALGSALKDRSVGAVVRYNRLDGAARSLDLVEAEDYPSIAIADPRYRETFVYGNLITKDGTTGIPVHYGGDHYGAKPDEHWGEPVFRKGTLYFFHNTVVLSGDGWSASMFQLSTTEEHAEIFNNVFVYTGRLKYAELRAGQEVGPSYTSGGLISLGVNSINKGWVPHDPTHPVKGQVLGSEHMMISNTPPIDLVSYVPLPGSNIIDAAIPGPAGVEGHPVLWQLGPTLRPERRVMSGAAMDLGAVERSQASSSANESGSPSH